MRYIKIISISPLLVVFILLYLFIHGLPANADPYIYYKPGTKFFLTANWWGLTANGTMEVFENEEFMEKKTILVRSQVKELGGFLGFIVKFLRIYRESNTFDSYIDTQTLMPVRYEVYKLDDGSKKLTENVYFDRKRNLIKSVEDNSIIIENIPPDTQDSFSMFLNLIRRFNTERMFVGKKFYVNLYAYKKISRIELEVTRLQFIDGKAAYTVEVDELPDIFKYPASLVFKVFDNGNGVKLPTTGECTIDVPVLKSITVDGELREVK